MRLHSRYNNRCFSKQVNLKVFSHDSTSCLMFKQSYLSTMLNIHRKSNSTITGQQLLFWRTNLGVSLNKNNKPKVNEGSVTSHWKLISKLFRLNLQIWVVNPIFAAWRCGGVKYLSLRVSGPQGIGGEVQWSATTPSGQTVVTTPAMPSGQKPGSTPSNVRTKMPPGYVTDSHFSPYDRMSAPHACSNFFENSNTLSGVSDDCQFN